MPELAQCDPFHRSHEAIAAAGQGLNESRIARRIPEGFADAIDRRVYAVFVIDKGSVGPQFAGDFFAGEQLARPSQQHAAAPEGLRVQLDADALPAKLSRGSVGFKCSEAIAQGWLWVCHAVRTSVFDREFNRKRPGKVQLARSLNCCNYLRSEKHSRTR